MSWHGLIVSACALAGALVLMHTQHTFKAPELRLNQDSQKDSKRHWISLDHTGSLVGNHRESEDIHQKTYKTQQLSTIYIGENDRNMKISTGVLGI